MQAYLLSNEYAKQRPNREKCDKPIRCQGLAQIVPRRALCNVDANDALHDISSFEASSPPLKRLHKTTPRQAKQIRHARRELDELVLDQQFWSQSTKGEKTADGSLSVDGSNSPPEST